VKVRGAYGRAIRVPPAGAGFGEISSTLIVQPNPLLSPERQGGWDGGVDLVFAGRGTLSVTGFDQTAKDLIAFLLVGTSPLPTFQYQNVGRVSNRGIEVAGTLTPGPRFTLKAQYGFVRSRVEELGPGITSEAQVQVGDPPLGVPAHTAGAAVTVTPLRGTTFNVGFSYLSSFRQLDILAQLRCFGGTGPCQSSPRGYIISYPGFVKVNASVAQRVTSYLDALLTVENLNNSEAHEYWNGYAVVGRLTMLGVRANW
jgi:outer membrane receptor protein involved in Fe transport